MKTSLILLLATVIPFGWVVLGAMLLWRFALHNRGETKTVVVSVPDIAEWASTEMLRPFEWCVINSDARI